MWIGRNSRIAAEFLGVATAVNLWPLALVLLIAVTSKVVYLLWLGPLIAVVIATGLTSGFFPPCSSITPLRDHHRCCR